MSLYKHIGGECLRHRFRRFVDLVRGVYWEQCIDCGKRNGR